jgi:hypothetical protein|tara:strand:+ start:189 stop:584 length:396 start_codon:yes stop_codon:yes gene_type:complete
MSNKIDTHSLSKIMEKYIRLTNNIKDLDKQSRELKKDKTNTEELLINLIEKNKLTEREFIKGNFKIRYESHEKKDGLNQKFLKNSLEQYFITSYSDKLSDKRCIEKAEEIFNYILSLRKSRVYPSLKQLPL